MAILGTMAAIALTELQMVCREVNSTVLQQLLAMHCEFVVQKFCFACRVFAYEGHVQMAQTLRSDNDLTERCKSKTFMHKTCLRRTLMSDIAHLPATTIWKLVSKQQT